jgi:predicted nuclease of restriction endonuclease-like (RecB) superfamily
MENEKRKQRGKIIKSVVLPLPEHQINLPQDYSELIFKLKNKILEERLKVTLSANASMILLYWEIGTEILQRQQKESWGAKVIDRLSFDLKKSFPEMSGFSPRNLKYMRKFAEAYPDKSIVQRVVAQLPWRTNITLLDKLTNLELRLWYANKTIENGFGKTMLEFQIESQLHKRQGAIINNFASVIPPLDSDFTSQIFKDPYVFDFLGTAEPRKEAELEQKLIDHIQKFLIELGQGFAFVGRQVHIELGDSDFYIDLLFYHLQLRCYVVIELKAGDFQPEYISKLNMYQNIVNDSLRHPDDKPSIGLLLVKSKNKTLVEYSLNGFSNPISVANWKNELNNSLPEDLKTSLPSIEEIEKELQGKN